MSNDLLGQSVSLLVLVQTEKKKMSNDYSTMTRLI